jgi:hypothetical protein
MARAATSASTTTITTATMMMMAVCMEPEYPLSGQPDRRPLQ